MKEQKLKKFVVINQEKILGYFTRNRHGWFCDQLGSQKWNYKVWGAQLAMSNPTEAAMVLARHYQ